MPKAVLLQAGKTVRQALRDKPPPQSPFISNDRNDLMMPNGRSRSMRHSVLKYVAGAAATLERPETDIPSCRLFYVSWP